MITSREYFPMVLRNAMDDNHLDAKSLAKLMNRHPSSVYKWLSGVQWPGILIRQILGQELCEDSQAFITICESRQRIL